MIKNNILAEKYNTIENQNEKYKSAMLFALK